MAEIKCPMCGKANPDGSDVCAFCGARLTPLRATPPPDEPGGVPAPDDDALPDWLTGLREDNPASSPDRPEGGVESEGEAEMPDWLARIRGDSTDAPGSQSNTGPDWLRGLAAASEAPAAEPAAEPGELPGWLDALRSAEGENPPPPLGEGRGEGSPESSPVNDETPDWLKAFSETNASEDSPAPFASTPPALTPPDRPEGGVEGGDETVSSEETPDWLKAFSEPTGEEPAALDAELRPTPPPLPKGRGAIESPSSFTPPAFSPPEPVEGGDETVSSEETPDWLKAFGEMNASEDSHDPLPSTGSGSVTSDETPDWLKAFSEQTASDAETEPTPPPLPKGRGAVESPSDETPDWLSDLPANPTSEHEYSTAELRDWSSGENEETTPPTEQPPDWLKMFEEATPVEPIHASDTPPPVSPFAGDDLPDWVSAGADNAPLPDEDHPAGEAAPGEPLAAAQLPSWLEAMRPMESVLPHAAPLAEEEDVIEKAGPLAGLVGVLPGEKLVAGKPPVYSTRLQVSERQRAQADLIESMLSEEAKPRAARPERSRAPQVVVRLLIALALLLVTALPLVAGTQILPPPALYPPETVAFHSLVEALPQNAPVLVAVDYEPGFAAELQLSGANVIQHLAARQARLSIMSTTPAGPVLAGALLDSTLAEPVEARVPASLPSTSSGGEPTAPTSSPSTGSGSVNLGYLPGGTAGLQEFASRPRVALPYTFQGESAWEQPALQGVGKLSDFSLVIVLTESAETARAWIEQVRPALGQTPLLFVISAQSAPFIQPYLDSQQVQGMVAGMAGGVIYARIAGQTPAGQPYWDAYQFGLFFAVLLVMLGGVWRLGGLLFTRKPARKGSEPR